MLKELKFVQGAIAKKDFEPSLTHFLIRGGRVLGYNGVLGLCAPIECDLDIAPNAVQFIRAMRACNEAVSLHMQGDRLCVKSGTFKTLVDCIDVEDHLALRPAGNFIELDGTLLAALKKLEPFVAVDASRPWACGILLKGKSAFATNNVTIVQYWLGYDFPVTVNIPIQAVRELIRIGEEPVGLQVTDDRLTFYYEGSRWLMTKLSVLEWPDVEPLLEAPGELKQPPKGFWEALETIKPFTDEMNRVYLRGDRLVTTLDDTATVVQLPEVPEKGTYNCLQLLALEGVASKIDFSPYPAACRFAGPRVRGALLGYR